MTTRLRLKSVSRMALGVVLGLGLAGAVAFQPARAFAQAVEAAPAPAAARVVPQAEGQGPALWVVRDADSTLYLFGTVHVLRPSTAWGSPASTPPSTAPTRSGLKSPTPTIRPRSCP